MSQGLFIAFEGGEGAGKSTQVRLLAEALSERGADVLTTREPGGTPLGRDIRKLLLDDRDDPIAERAELLLYAADRAQHVQTVIRPALEAGKVVLCDRYIGSTIAYQAAGKGLDPLQVGRLCRYAIGGVMPDLTLFLDIDPEAGLSRAIRRGHANRFERAPLDFHHRVYASFVAQSCQPRWARIDAAPDSWTVHQSVLARTLGEAVWLHESAPVAAAGRQDH